MNYKALPHDVCLRGCNWLLRWPSHPLRRAVLRSFGGARLGRGTSIERDVRLMRRGELHVGDNTIVNSGTVLDSRGGLWIGSTVNIAPQAMLLTAEHDIASPGFYGRTKAVRIGDRVWISTRAIVLPGCEVGEGAVIAAGAVVTRDVAPWTVVAGNPARPIGERPRDAQQFIHKHRMWLH